MPQEKQLTRSDIENRNAWEKIWRGHWYSDPNRRLRRSWYKLDAIQSHYGDINVGSVICEIGCGAGYFIGELTKRNPQIRRAVGCDYSLAALQQAISNFEADPRLKFVAADAVSLPLETHIFDAAFAICVLEHITDMRAAIKELARVLKPNAKLFIFFRIDIPSLPGSGEFGA